MPDPNTLVLHGGPVRVRPGGRLAHWVYRCVNRTGEPIHDLHLDTDLTNGIDPDINTVKVIWGGSTVGSLGGHSDTSAHLSLRPPIPVGARFDLELACDGPFESDERLEVTPTNDQGAAIEGLGSSPDKWHRVVDLPRGGVRLRPGSRLQKWSFRLRNETGEDVHDLFLDTDLTSGDEPDLLHVRVEHGGRRIADQAVPDETSAHVRFDAGEKVPPRGILRVTFECDDWFEDDEAIEIRPTNAVGAVIEAPVRTAGRWPCADGLFFSPWKWVREHVWPFTAFGWIRGPRLTVHGKVTSVPYCHEDGDYCFDLQLCENSYASAFESAGGVHDAAFPGDGRSATLHCEITPGFQTGEPPRHGRFYEVVGQLRYDRGHGWWEIHPAQSWKPVDECELRREP
ncbi:MAG: hypothetical protein DWQ36_08815 [Acidobacteria bacterium]|nr:MAG: hypothetical protein DWQ30_18245 [Acidobacteriota bacterium]REK08743.1 MAG: hypothetical protein DWQ36_08815 [Acidobacteriota bacterium]